MGSELVSVLALGEAREVLAALRKNQRFATWSHTDLEHPLIVAIKSVRHIVRAGSIAGRLDVSQVLAPFLEVVRSPEAGGMITGTTLAAIERIISYGISDASASLAGAPDALREVIRAVAECRFDATDAAVDENALTMICRVVVATLTCGPWGDTMSDETVLMGFETVLRIIGGRRRSDLLKSVARQSLCSVIAALTRRIDAIAPDENDKAQDGVDLTFLSEPKDPLLREIQQYGIFNFSFSVESPSSEPCYTPHSLQCILRFASFVVDPMAAPSGLVSPDHRLLGFSLLNAALCSAPSSQTAPLMAVRSTRRVLLRETSRAVLRSLGASLTEPTRNVSAAFTTALNLLHALGSYGGPFLAMLLQKVFPPFVTGKLDPNEDVSGSYGVTHFDEGTREIGLEALGALFAQPGLLAVAYASIDCNLKFADAVEPLLQGLRAMVEGEDGSWRNADQLDGNDGLDDEEVRVGRAAALVCADTLIGAIDSVSDRVKASAPETGARTGTSGQSRGLSMESVEALRARKSEKTRLMDTVDEFNRSKGKKGAKGVIRLVQRLSAGDEDVADDVVSPEDMDAAVNFLRTTPRLNKSVIGVILGEPDEVSASFLKAYTSTFKFSNRSFTAALRIFLESFRLPGEAQKIDRIVHSFSQHYYEENRGDGENEADSPLRNADAAYVLAYSVVMLNTDLHNHSVRKKMTFDDFIRNNRGINDGKDVPREFLREIFESIAAVEIKMSDEAGIGFLTDIHWDEVLREAHFLASTDDAGSRGSGQNPFLLSYPDDARVFDEEVFKICWQPALTAAVVALEESRDPVPAQAALEGFLSVARCASSYRMSEPINACVSSLCTASALLEGSLHGAILRFGTSVKAQMAAVALLGVARQCGDWMRGPGWQPLIACILRLHVLGLLPDTLEARFYGYGDDLVSPDGKPLPPSKLMPVWWPAAVANQREANAGTDESLLRRKRRTPGFLNAMGGLLRVGMAKSDLDDDDEVVVRLEDGIKFTVSQYPPAYLRADDAEHVEARNLARKCIAECRVEDILINETKFLRSDALKSVASSIASAAEKALSGSDWLEPEDEDVEELSGKLRKLTRSPVVTTLRSTEGNLGEGESITTAGESEVPQIPMASLSAPLVEESEAELSDRDDNKTRSSVAAFCAELLCQITLRNRDRMGITWPYVNKVTVQVIASAREPTVLLERACVALLRIAARFLHRDEVRSDVLKALNLIVQLRPEIVSVISSPVMAGIYHMVKAHSMHITETSCWHSILSLIESSARSPEPAPSIGFEALGHLLSKEVLAHALTRETYAPFLDTVSAFAISKRYDPRSALDLLFVLSTRVEYLSRANGSTEEANREANASGAWNEFWEPLLRAFFEVTNDTRVAAKHYAMVLLERVIGGRGPDALSLTAWDWMLTFKKILFPLLRSTFASDAVRKQDMESEEFQKAKFRSVTLVSKTFLQHHGMLAHELTLEDFVEIWSGVLDSMQLALDSCEEQRQNRANNPSTSAKTSPADEGASALLEHIPESAKNIALVMASSGLLVEGDGPLWEVTAGIVPMWVPDVADVVRVAQNGSSPFEWRRREPTPAPEPSPAPESPPALEPAPASEPAPAEQTDVLDAVAEEASS